MFKRLIAYLVGTLRIEVTRGTVEAFLNIAVAQAIHVWAIERTPHSLRATIVLRDFYALRPVLRGSGCRVRILNRRGLPFFTVRLRRRPVLLAGAAACAAILFWASGHIWFVRVKITGPQNLDWRAVEAVAAEAGLRSGAWKGGLDVTKVQEHIQRAMGDVSWAVVRVQGTRAVIEVVEKSSQKLAGDTGCVNLVARRSGVIEQLVPFQGEPMVKKGDIVKAGDLLVECSLRYWGAGRPAVLPGTEKPPRESVARTLVAQARVMARVSIRQYREVPLYQDVPIPTGRKNSQWVLNWFDRPIIMRGSQGEPFPHSQTRRRTIGLGTWRNWKFPVELIVLETEEVERQRARIPQAEAIDRVRESVAAQLRWSLGPADKLIGPIEIKVVELASDYVGVQIAVDTLQEISQPRDGTPPAPLPTPSP